MTEKNVRIFAIFSPFFCVILIGFSLVFWNLRYNYVCLFSAATDWFACWILSSLNGVAKTYERDSKKKNIVFCMEEKKKTSENLF